MRSYRYYAKNIGLIKEIRTDQGGGWLLELSAARIGGTSYPPNASICVARGTWNDTTGHTGNFSFFYNSQDSPIQAPLVITEYIAGTGDYIPGQNATLISQDGVTFTGDPDISITINNGAVTGTEGTTNTYTGTVSCGN